MVSLVRNTLVSLNKERVVTLNRNQVVSLSEISIQLAECGFAVPQPVDEPGGADCDNEEGNGDANSHRMVMVQGLDLGTESLGVWQGQQHGLFRRAPDRAVLLPGMKITVSFLWRCASFRISEMSFTFSVSTESRLCRSSI